MSWFYNEQYDESFNHQYINSQAGAVNPNGNNGVNRSYNTSAQFLRYFDQTYNVVANFNRTFDDKHTVNVMAGTEFYKRRYRGSALVDTVLLQATSPVLDLLRTMLTFSRAL